MTPSELAEIVATGERRIRERRVGLPSDLTTEFINRLTADRDRLKAENRTLREALARKDKP